MIIYETSKGRYSIKDDSNENIAKNLSFSDSNEDELQYWINWCSKDDDVEEYLKKMYDDKYNWYGVENDPSNLDRFERVEVSNTMQKNYVYFRTKPEWEFDDYPDFTPDLTPKEVLEYWAFSWKYFWDIPGTDEYPEDFEKVVENASAWVDEWEDNSMNYFKIKAGQDLEDWEEKGWIRDQDPRGWFEWYTRFYFGRRSPDDERQIQRWKNITRFLTQVQNVCDVWDHDCKTKLRQLLLQWSYDTVEKY